MSSDGTIQTALVNDGYIYGSTDSGVTWTQRTTDATRNWISIAMSSDGTKQIAVGTSGQVFISPNSGGFWGRLYQNITTDGFINASIDSVNKLIILTTNNNIYYCYYTDDTFNTLLYFSTVPNAITSGNALVQTIAIDNTMYCIGTNVSKIEKIISPAV